MLGACDEIFVTDDSVNMVSEVVTAGHRAVLLRTERAGLFIKKLQTATRIMVSAGLLPPRALWGVPRFDMVLESFRNMGLLIDFRNWIHEQRRSDIAPVPTVDGEYDWSNEGFNEARRAADWILNDLPNIVHAAEEES
jgi:hypothetical protein